MTRWEHRIAEYNDLLKALHIILMEYFGMSAEQAVPYTLHGFRHTMVVAGAQLRQQKMVSTEGMESLGHWERGSAMPNRYDTAAGVTELGTRLTITNAIRAGWRPAAEGEAPYRSRYTRHEAGNDSVNREEGE